MILHDMEEKLTQVLRKQCGTMTYGDAQLEGYPGRQPPRGPSAMVSHRIRQPIAWS